MGEQGVTGICGSGIIEAIACMYLAGVIRQDGSINGEAASLSDGYRPVTGRFPIFCTMASPES